MAWLSFDDGYTDQPVWDGLPYDTRWHYHAFIQKCCATRRYDGLLRLTAALRCSDVPDPERCLKELIEAGLLADHGAEVEAVHIEDFLPPPHLRPEQEAPRKRRNQAEYRRRKCERGEHDRHCPADTCPARQERVTGNPRGNPAGDPGSGRVGVVSQRVRSKSTSVKDQTSLRADRIGKAAAAIVERHGWDRAEARRIAGDILGRASSDVPNPGGYVLAAIEREPDRYRPPPPRQSARGKRCPHGELVAVDGSACLECAS